nr:hypothetical protein [Acidiferrobacterales bacterium]
PELPMIIDSTERLRESLPFEIGSIVTGPFGHITTRDGDRLSIGQTKLGFTLVSIKEGSLVFEGEQKFEINW